MHLMRIALGLLGYGGERRIDLFGWLLFGGGFFRGCFGLVGVVGGGHGERSSGHQITADAAAVPCRVGMLGEKQTWTGGIWK